MEVTTMPARRPLEERFWEKVNKAGPTQPHMTTPCWVWTGSTSAGGYGRFNYDGKVINAQRASLLLSGKTMEEAECGLHHCDHPPCVREDHLYIGTKKHNAEDREERGRANHATGERHGTVTHPDMNRGENNGRAKITAEDARNLRELAARGHAIAHLAEELGITKVAAYDILHGKLWPHAGGPIVAERLRRHDLPLSVEQIASIRKEYTGKYGEQKALAQKYNVDVQTIRRITQGKTHREEG